MSKRAPASLPADATSQWRSPDERDPEVLAARVAEEFPRGASELDGASRREFMQLLGASAALAGVGALAGCKDPPERIMPYNLKPGDVTPGRPLHYATALTHGGYATGVLVTAWEGRPTKIEGNPDHPVSRGATSTIDQAAILSLYDEHRAREIKQRGVGRSWKDFVHTLARRLDEHKKDGGKKLAFLLEPSASPLLGSLQKRIATALPNTRFFSHAVESQHEAYEGARIAFGNPVETCVDYTKARIVVALDADFLGGAPGSVASQRQWSERRAPGANMSRLYVAEAAMTCTGMMADHRLRARASDVGGLARALLAAVQGGASPGVGDAKTQAWLKAVAKDLIASGGDAVVVVGARQPAAVHAIVHGINAATRSAAVRYTAPLLPAYEPVTALPDDLETLVVTAWNPAYASAGDLDLAARLKKVPNLIYLAPYEDETAALATWVVPRAHELECWGDARAVDGTVTIQQPLTNPLYSGVSAAELLAVFVGDNNDGYHLVRESYKRLDEAAFQRQLQKGVVDGTTLAVEAPAVRAAAVSDAAASLTPAPAGLELNLVVDKLYDGRHANNVWLQELPHPISKLTWDNALLVSPATAEKLAVKAHDRVAVKSAAGGSVTVPVLVSPGHADDSATLALGYGRNTGAELHARGAGVDAYPLLSKKGFFSTGLEVERAGKGEKLSITQEHWTQEGRPVALMVSNRQMSQKRLPVLNDKDTGVETVQEVQGEVESVYTAHQYPGFQWAMSIDLNKCTGCSACVVACQAENNIPVVGREQVKRSREMHWIRVDVYYSGDENDPSSATPQPMMCVHCEKAPCEYVCPVAATVHSDEGLNEMVYNRCIGTRYCSNNCPYKVRRFNFLDYHPTVQPVARMGMNPDVTVRSRGVMEKCTYCVQRIERTRIDARVDGRPIADGEIVTACQQVCPSRAITFGSLHDKQSAVSKLHEDPRAYNLLHELGTRPRTVHLARVRNQNPELTNG